MKPFQLKNQIIKQIQSKNISLFTLTWNVERKRNVKVKFKNRNVKRTTLKNNVAWKVGIILINDFFSRMIVKTKTAKEMYFLWGSSIKGLNYLHIRQDVKISHILSQQNHLQDWTGITQLYTRQRLKVKIVCSMLLVPLYAPHSPLQTEVRKSDTKQSILSKLTTELLSTLTSQP